MLKIFKFIQKIFLMAFIFSWKVAFFHDAQVVEFSGVLTVNFWTARSSSAEISKLQWWKSKQVVKDSQPFRTIEL